MKKYFKNYAIIWLCAVVVFSAIVFIVRMLSDSVDATFVIAYLLVVAAFGIQMGVAYKFFSEENINKIFLNMPFLTLTKGCVVVSAILATILMVLPISPYIALLSSIVVLALYVVALAKADTAASVIDTIDQNVKTQTFYMKSLTVDAQSVMARAQTPEIKAVANNVYELIRYSDPMSNPALAGIESQITLKFSEYAQAVQANNLPAAQAASNDLNILVQDRNNKCKLLK